MLCSYVRFKGLLVLSILGATAGASAQDLGTRIDNYLVEQVRTSGIPGLTAAVVRDGDVVYAGAHGVRKLGEDEELTPRHVFHFASASKPFVATAIVQLVEQGKLDLDDPVTRSLPYFTLSDERFRDIPIRQMLNHTSGMPDVGWRYSNMAFDALGDVIAKASAMSFEAYMRTNILEPLGMDHTSFIFPEINEALRTTGHVGDPAQVSDVYPYNRRHAPSSTLNSSVLDMARWMLVNLNRGELDGRWILRAESHDLLWTPTTEKPADTVPLSRALQIGLSWAIGEHAGHQTVFHGGRDTGFRSYVLLLPDDGIGIVLASNWEQTDTPTLARGILDMNSSKWAQTTGGFLDFGRRLEGGCAV